MEGVTTKILGRAILSNNEGDGKENGKKVIK